MSEPTTYRTSGGSTVTLGFTIALYGPVHTIDCDGCGGGRGFKTADQADTEARKHAERCTDQPGNGGAS